MPPLTTDWHAYSLMFQNSVLPLSSFSFYHFFYYFAFLFLQFGICMLFLHVFETMRAHDTGSSQSKWVWCFLMCLRMNYIYICTLLCVAFLQRLQRHHHHHCHRIKHHFTRFAFYMLFDLGGWIESWMLPFYFV